MTHARLSNANLASLPERALRPAYDRSAQRVGIVHFGIGAFHRSHQAMYTDDAMGAGDRDWAITGVSLRSRDVHDALQPQDGLYSLIARDDTQERVRVIGSVRNVLVAREHAEAVIATLASPNVHIVTFTVTEKGYVRDSSTGSLLLNAPDLAHDLRGEGLPRTIYGFLEHAFARRRAAGLPGLSLVSCDNLADNGRQLAKLLHEYLERRDPALAAWCARETSCPATMVDRIVPATTARDLKHIAEVLGCEDRGAVITEPFTQWVIEDKFVGPRPRWEQCGAQLTTDVRPFEIAKLRMLNGPHSTLAYVGLGLGFEYVHQAVADPQLRALVTELMMTEAATSFTPMAGQDLVRYGQALLTRFENSALGHRLIQIAMDGTQKIPQRWLLGIGELQKQGKSVSALLFALAAWIAFFRTPGRVLDDPLAKQLVEIRERTSESAEAAVQAIVGSEGLFSAVWRADAATVDRIVAHLEVIERQGMRAALERALQKR